jgi:hypothetical protein
MPMVDPDIEFCLRRVGKSVATWNTLVVHGSAEAAQSTEDLWSVWAALERWPSWSPLHRSVTRAVRGS